MGEPGVYRGVRAAMTRVRIQVESGRPTWAACFRAAAMWAGVRLTSILMGLGARDFFMGSVLLCLGRLGDVGQEVKGLKAARPSRKVDQPSPGGEGEHGEKRNGENRQGDDPQGRPQE